MKLLTTTRISSCYTEVVPTFLHTSSLVLAIGLAFAWLSVPGLSQYSLQAFGLTILAYLILKRFTRAELWHIAPTPGSLEMSLVTFAFFILIGGTGNLTSVFFPLSFAYLFFLILASELPTIVIVTACLMLFHLGLTPELTQIELAHWLSLPLLMVLFLFGKYQYDQATSSHRLLVVKDEHLIITQANQSEVQRFLAEYLQPKLLYLQELAKFPDPNRRQLQQQLTTLTWELSKLLKKLSA